MARAGFWPISSTRKITFGRDGHWYADGERIKNRRIERLLSKSLKQTSGGAYAVEIGWDRAEVEIEDTPYVVTRVTGDPSSGFTLALNDESQEALVPATLLVGADHVLYCRVKEGCCESRFLRPAYYQLTAHVEEKDGAFFLRTKDGVFPFGPAGPGRA